jgi:hypothetical protein
VTKTKLLAVLFFATQLIYTQETNSVSGGKVTGVDGSVSYTVGQTLYTTHTSEAGSLHQGIQQGFDFVTLSNPALTEVTLKAFTYPNPTTEFIILAIKDGSLTAVSYAMYDLLGRFVSKGTVT